MTAGVSTGIVRELALPFAAMRNIDIGDLLNVSAFRADGPSASEKVLAFFAEI